MKKSEWENLYKEGDTPWRGKSGDLSAWLKKSKISSGNALDLGCGTGEKSAWLADHGFAVEGLDISNEAIKISKEASPKPIFTVWDLENLENYPFRHEKYDLIIDVRVFRFIENPEKYLDVVRSRLGGIFILSVFLRNDEKPSLVINEGYLEKILTSRFGIVSKNLIEKPGTLVGEYFLAPK